MDLGWPEASFEAFAVGQTFTTGRRTITEADVAAFAGLSGDYGPLHTDAVYAAEGPFGRRIAHGLLSLAVATGLVARLGWFEQSVLAFRELRCKFRRPVYPGDTVRVAIEVTRTRALPRAGGGLVNLDVRVLNQEDEIVLSSVWSVLMRGGIADSGAA
jgi:acyl dehydratase